MSKLGRKGYRLALILALALSLNLTGLETNAEAQRRNARKTTASAGRTSRTRARRSSRSSRTKRRGRGAAAASASKVTVPVPPRPTEVKGQEINDGDVVRLPPSAPPAPRVVKPISGGVLNGRALSLPVPVYPPIARAAGASGTVVVQVVVDEAGNVIMARAASGHPLLQQAAVNAAKEAKFSPTMLSGQPVKVTGVLTFNFVSQ
ncbi:MAG TPA: energy transducer TonB [Pyrinomonadaceae bacterium]|jgi:TonB family protein